MKSHSSGRALPPRRRSRVALGLTGFAATGGFALQVCDECGRVQYPPQEICVDCLSTSLKWQAQPCTGKLLAAAEVYQSLEPSFNERPPSRSGLVRHSSGAILVAFVAEDCAVGDPVNLSLELTSGGGAVFLVTGQPTNDNEDDTMANKQTNQIVGRTCFVTDENNPLGLACAAALRTAGAKRVWSDQSTDVKDEEVEIVVDTSGYSTGLRPFDDQFERLLAHEKRFAPALSRHAGVWVSVLSFAALAPYPSLVRHSAQMAAAHAVAVSLRSKLLANGARLIAFYPARLDIDAHATLEGAKLSLDSLALAVTGALSNGHEDVFPDPQARLWYERLLDDPKALERELSDYPY